MILRTLVSLRCIPKISYMPFKSITMPHLYFKTQIKASLQQQLLKIASKIKDESIKEDFTEIVRNYIQLSQKSFVDYIKSHESDPQLLLMLISTFENPQKVRQFLPFLYHKINYFEKKQMLHLLQKILAFKPSLKPKIPHPRPLEQIESILVLLSQLYKCDLLQEWIKYVPLYQGNQKYIVVMGYFSILEKMSPEIKQKNRPVLIKCHKKIYRWIQDEQITSEEKVGIVLLAFELNYKQALHLFLASQIDFSEIKESQKYLFLVNMTKFLQKQNILKSVMSQPEQDSKQSQIYSKLHGLIKQMINKQYKDFMNQMKIQILLSLWETLGKLPVLKGQFLALSRKLGKVTADNDYSKTINQLKIQQIITILECMAKHKINHQKLLKKLLTLCSPKLSFMDKKLLIRLLKCQVTYVRQCEDYLINCRKILQERKLQFSERQAEQINQVLRRVLVLFPRPFKVTP